MITSTVNDRVKWVRGLQRRRRARDREGIFVAEGTRWAQEFVAAEAHPEYLFHTAELAGDERAIVDQLAARGAQILPVADEVMASLSDTETPQSLLVVARQPQLAPPAKPRLALVADRLRDPGNMGTLLRTALAADVDLVLLTEGTVDPYNPKVVRGAMGAQLHLPIRRCSPGELEAALQGLPLWLAEVDAGRAYTQVDWRDPCGLVIGSEAHGVGRHLRQLAHERTHIPLRGPSDSLNAAIAAAVILFEIKRQRGNS